MSLLVAAGIFQHNQCLPALIPFFTLLVCSKVSSKIMSWAVQHNSVFEAKTWTSLLRPAAAKRQHFLLKIRERIHILRAFLTVSLQGEAYDFSSTCKGTLEEFCYDRLSYYPWTHQDSIRCQISYCLGFIPSPLMHFGEKYIYWVAGPSAQLWEGLFAFHRPLQAGFWLEALCAGQCKQIT